MPTLDAHEPAAPSHAAGDRLALRCVQVVIVLLLVSMMAAGRDKTYWPVATWPVYAERRFVMPPETIDTVEVRVTTADGRSHRLRVGDLIEFSRHDIALRTMYGSVDADDPAVLAVYRAHLAYLVAAAIGDGRFDALEVWRIRWAVDPLATPPLDFDAPASTTRLARFPAPPREAKP